MLPGRRFIGRRFDSFGALESLASGKRYSPEGPGKPCRVNCHPKRCRIYRPKIPLMPRARAKTGRLMFIDETLDYLAIAVVNVYCCFDPQLIVIGGGVARSADLLIKPILAKLDGILPVMPHIGFFHAWAACNRYGCSCQCVA